MTSCLATLGKVVSEEFGLVVGLVTTVRMGGNATQLTVAEYYVVDRRGSKRRHEGVLVWELGF